MMDFLSKKTLTRPQSSRRKSEYSDARIKETARALDDRDLKWAEDIAFQSLLESPFDLDVLRQCAHVAIQSKNWHAAAVHWLAIKKLEQNISPNTYAGLVQALRNSKHFKLADRVAREGLRKFPNHMSIQSEYAWVAQSTKDWSAAARRLEEIIESHGKQASGKVRRRLNEVRASLKENAFFEKGAQTLDGSEGETEQNGGLNSGGDIRNIIITTYPKDTSRNVGDSLITESARSLLSRRTPNAKVAMKFRAEALDSYQDGSIANIIAPGFSVSDGAYPNLFSLYKDFSRIPDFYPVGCSFQHPTPAKGVFDGYQYSAGTLSFLKHVSEKFGPFPCRDQMIVDLLRRHGVEAVYSGDLALYDESFIGAEFVPPCVVKKIVFTIPHGRQYEIQSMKLLVLLKHRFPSASLHVSFHSRPNADSQRIADFGEAVGYEIINVSGDASNLAVYDGFDLHVGYRLHGHLAFLRRRKPSILLIEDARSYGFSKTPMMGAGCFETLFDPERNKLDMQAPEKVIKYIDEQMAVNFKDYQASFACIDETYRKVIDPLFNRIASKMP